MPHINAQNSRKCIKTLIWFPAQPKGIIAFLKDAYLLDDLTWSTVMMMRKVIQYFDCLLQKKLDATRRVWLYKKAHLKHSGSPSTYYSILLLISLVAAGRFFDCGDNFLSLSFSFCLVDILKFKWSICAEFLFFLNGCTSLKQVGWTGEEVEKYKMLFPLYRQAKTNSLDLVTPKAPTTRIVLPFSYCSTNIRIYF